MEGEKKRHFLKNEHVTSSGGKQKTWYAARVPSKNVQGAKQQILQRTEQLTVHIIYTRITRQPFKAFSCTMFALTNPGVIRGARISPSALLRMVPRLNSDLARSSIQEVCKARSARTSQMSGGRFY